MNETQKITCRGRRDNGNCLLAEEKEQLRRDYEQIKTDHCGALERSIEANRDCLRLQAVESEAATMRQVIEEYCKCCGLCANPATCRCDCELLITRNTTAGADLLARHNAEVALYRDALDEIRDLCEEESPAMATLGELAEIADQALNDRWGADELLYRVQKLEAVAAAAKKWASMRQGYGHGHRISEYADTSEHEKVMSYLRLAGDDIEAALAALDTDGCGK